MKLRRTTTKNSTGGALRSFIHFQNRGEVDDGFGNMVPGGPFVTQFSAYANFRPLLRGSASGVEDVFADRLQGNQPYIITVRNQAALQEVTIAWRIVDARSLIDEDEQTYKKVYNIKSPPVDSTNGYMWLEFVATLDAPN
jgi:head-tail adaptor